MSQESLTVNTNIKDQQNQEIDYKHNKYFDMFKPNDLFYGLGIENETYFMLNKTIAKKGKFIKHQRKRERYSVDYFFNFVDEEVNKSLDSVDVDKVYELPVFINSHTFVKCDKNGQHSRLYTKDCEPNPKFDGKILHDIFMEKSEILKKLYDMNYVYDGDSIEIMTTNFYKTTVNDVINELINSKKIVLEEINNVIKNENITFSDIFCNYYFRNKTDQISFLFQDHNYGIVNNITNPFYMSICNNGTYHFNITLPTQLDENCNIKDRIRFDNIHANAIRAIQWLEPLFVSLYGSPDIFSVNNDKFSKGSLRVALSRYIGIGTYDSNKMETGKKLNDFIVSENDNNWYLKYHSDENNPYIRLSQIGYDINFNKFKNHGIEIRFFDYFPEKYLYDVINILLLLCTISMYKNIPDPTKDPVWINQACLSVKYGYNHKVDIEYSHYLTKIFIFDEQKNMNIQTNNNSRLSNVTDSFINKLKVKINRFFSFIIDFVSSFDKNEKDSDENKEPDIILQEILTDPKDVFQNIVDHLYDKLKNDTFINQISPNMTKPSVSNYNKEMYEINASLFTDLKYSI